MIAIISKYSGTSIRHGHWGSYCYYYRHSGVGLKSLPLPPPPLSISHHYLQYTNSLTTNRGHTDVCHTASHAGIYSQYQYSWKRLHWDQ